jgi:hypothetical protein
MTGSCGMDVMGPIEASWPKLPNAGNISGRVVLTLLLLGVALAHGAAVAASWGASRVAGALKLPGPAGVYSDMAGALA